MRGWRWPVARLEWRRQGWRLNGYGVAPRGGDDVPDNVTLRSRQRFHNFPFSFQMISHPGEGGAQQ